MAIIINPLFVGLINLKSKYKINWHQFHEILRLGLTPKLTLEQLYIERSLKKSDLHNHRNMGGSVFFFFPINLPSCLKHESLTFLIQYNSFRRAISTRISNNWSFLMQFSLRCRCNTSALTGFFFSLSQTCRQTDRQTAATSENKVFGFFCCFVGFDILSKCGTELYWIITKVFKKQKDSVTFALRKQQQEEWASNQQLDITMREPSRPLDTC